MTLNMADWPDRYCSICQCRYAGREVKCPECGDVQFGLSPRSYDMARMKRDRNETPAALMGSPVEVPPSKPLDEMNDDERAATDAAMAKDAFDEACEVARDEQCKRADEVLRKATAFEKIAALNHAVRDAFQDWFNAAEKAKKLKKAWEGDVERLQSLIADCENPPPMPLFDGQPATNGEVNPSDESWKEVRLEAALPELSDTVLSKLNGAQLYTMGELANWTAEDGGRRKLSDIAGIGPGIAGKIEEATMAFWSRYKPNVEPSTNGDAEAVQDDGTAEAGDDDFEE